MCIVLHSMFSAQSALKCGAQPECNSLVFFQLFRTLYLENSYCGKVMLALMLSAFLNQRHLTAPLIVLAAGRWR